MFQREVAERLVAKPDTQGLRAALGAPAVARQREDPVRCQPRAFVPPPKVTSSVVRIEPLAEPVAPARLRRSGKVNGGGVRPAPQDAAPESEDRLSPDAEELMLRRGPRPNRAGRRRCRSPISRRWRGFWRSKKTRPSPGNARHDNLVERYQVACQTDEKSYSRRHRCAARPLWNSERRSRKSKRRRPSRRAPKFC